MIKVQTETDPRPVVYDRLRFKYLNDVTDLRHDRELSVKGLLQARKSGNNCDWSVFLPGIGWHSDFVFSYDIRVPDEITIIVKNLASRKVVR